MELKVQFKLQVNVKFTLHCKVAMQFIIQGSMHGAVEVAIQGAI